MAHLEPASGGGDCGGGGGGGWRSLCGARGKAQTLRNTLGLRLRLPIGLWKIRLLLLLLWLQIRLLAWRKTCLLEPVVLLGRSRW